MVLVWFAAFLTWLALGGGVAPWKGADFVGFWVPATLAAEGQAAAISDPVLLRALQESVKGQAPWYLAWPYPPTYLLILLPLGFLPYWWAFAAWEGAAFAVYWLAMRPIAGRDGLLLAIAFPGVWIGIVNGHAEFMLAGILGAALVRLDTNRLAAGVLIGLCAIKPHLFVLVPVALASARQWRVVSVAAMTVAAMAALSAVALGPQPWRAFFGEVIGLAHGVGSPQGGGFYSIATKQQSVFAYAAAIGSAQLALASQAVVTVGAAGAVALSWRAGGGLDRRAMTRVCGTLLATPYLFDYDLALLAVPIALVARRAMKDGWRAWEMTLLALLWILPSTARLVSMSQIPITPILLALSLATFGVPARARASGPAV